jgi:LysM repeat protein
MALPSQQDRSSELGRVSSNNSRGGPKKDTNPAMLLGGIALAVVAVVGLLWGLNTLSTSGTGTSGTKPQAAGMPGDPGTHTKDEGAKKVHLGPPKVEPAAQTPTTLAQGSPTPTTTPADPSGKPSPVDLSAPGAAPAVKPAESTTPTPVSTPPAPSGTTTIANATESSSFAPASPPSIPASGSTNDVRAQIEAGDSALARGNLLQARISYSRALLNPSASTSDKSSLRDKLTKINEELVFGNKVTAGDPLTEVYKVEPGDSLVKIARKRQLAADWRLIQRVNKLSSPNTIQVGQPLKLVRGPFHAIVSKGDFRLDLFAGSPDEPESWIYIRSFRVGLGAEDSSTPIGSFVVKKGSKLINPHWVNPRTGEKFDANDPKNPIGEHWVGLEGTGASAAYKGFGLHGTIEPDSIGKQRSMGCVRMGSDDIALVYEMLSEQISVVKIVP